MLQTIIDVFLHLDRHLGEFVQAHGAWTYGLLFAIVFPRDRRRRDPVPARGFPACSRAALWPPPAPSNRSRLFLVLATAAILGDTVNYSIGKAIGPRAFSGQIAS